MDGFAARKSMEGRKENNKLIIILPKYQMPFVDKWQMIKPNQNNKSKNQTKKKTTTQFICSLRALNVLNG